MKLLAALALLVLAWSALGGAVAAAVAAQPFKPRGEFVDIGGRKLRLVCEGPMSDAPVVWMEAGAFGMAADFAAIQQKLAAKGLRSCAYDRAGMGFSDPGPRPRDSDAIVGDLEKLIAASGETGPFILMGHSMAGLHVRHYAARNPEKVAGLVLIEAATPELSDSPGTRKFLNMFVAISRGAAVTGSLGLIKPFYLMGDRIGLPPQGRAEKRRAFISGRHMRTAANEVENWEAAGRQARASGAFDPAWPVAVIVAGAPPPGASEWNERRRAPERASRAGWYENVPDAEHATVLGLQHGDVAVRGVEHVLRSLRAEASPADR